MPSDALKPFDFWYETHLHTSEGSRCGCSTGAEMALAYRDLGYAGVIVTDHFFNGNCTVPADLPWPERVELFCQGYEHAREAAENSRFTVFFGWEFNFKGTEFLTYGLGKDFLLAHGDLLAWNAETYLKAVREAGGLVSQAHPFRMRSYIAEIRLFPEAAEAVEIHNASDTPETNARAAAYAREHALAFTAGSDSHSAPAPLPDEPERTPSASSGLLSVSTSRGSSDEPARNPPDRSDADGYEAFCPGPGGKSGMAFQNRLETAVDFIRAVRNREGRVLR